MQEIKITPIRYAAEPVEEPKKLVLVKISDDDHRLVPADEANPRGLREQPTPANQRANA